MAASSRVGACRICLLQERGHCTGVVSCSGFIPGMVANLLLSAQTVECTLVVSSSGSISEMAANMLQSAQIVKCTRVVSSSGSTPEMAADVLQLAQTVGYILAGINVQPSSARTHLP